MVDDTSGATYYSIDQAVIVTPNNNLANDLTSSILTNDLTNPLFIGLNSGNLNLVSKNVIAISTALNLQSTSKNESSQNIDSQTNKDETNNQVAQIREYLVEKISALSISDISSIKVISAALSTTTNSLEQITSNTAVYNI